MSEEGKRPMRKERVADRWEEMGVRATAGTEIRIIGGKHE